MKKMNAFKFNQAFKVLRTTERSQTAVMTLAPGEASSEEPNRHENSDQVIIVLEGEILAEVAAATAVLRKGDTLTVPADTPHKFSNSGLDLAVTLNVYAPPAYAPGEHESE